MTCKGNAVNLELFLHAVFSFISDIVNWSYRKGILIFVGLLIPLSFVKLVSKLSQKIFLSVHSLA